MLEIYSVAIKCCADVGRVAEDVARKDPSLADQLRRAMSSVALNLAEGHGSQGRNRNARYFNALGSAREVGCALEIAAALRYVEKMDPTLLDQLDRIRATIYRLLHR